MNVDSIGSVEASGPVAGVAAHPDADMPQPHGFLAVAEAALHHDGTDLYHYVSKKSGGSIKGMLDGYLRIAYPLERTGIWEDGELPETYPFAV